MQTKKAQTSLRISQTDQRLSYSLFGRIVSKLATCEIPFLQLISVAEETGWKLTLSETGGQVFSRWDPYNLRSISSS